jgi:hypothetical protein
MVGGKGKALKDLIQGWMVMEQQRTATLHMPLKTIA